MRPSLLPLSLAVVLESGLVTAVSIPFTVHHATPGSARLRTRADIATPSNTSINGIVTKNVQNAFYLANMTLGQETKRIMLDTGSSDLWVTGDVTGTQDSGKAVTLSYAVGKAKGDVNYANLDLGNFTVSNQAYLLVKDTSTFTTNISTQGYDGLVGLGPNSGSVIYRKMDKESKANSVMSRVFAAYKSTSNYMTFLLDRVSDPGQSFTGRFTIGEIVNGLESITSQPKMKVDKVHKLTSRDQHWQILIDKNGLIGPDGNPISYDTIVSGTDGQLVAVLDTGFTFPQVPRKVADAIYGRVQGAVYDTDAESWTIPCDQEVNVTFKFGGVSFPVHPLDTSDDNFQVRDDNGNRVCLGAFQPITSAFSFLGEFDIILGMSFMRNAYTYMDFGDFVSGSSGDPYVQLLSMTDAAAAHKDFVEVRLGGVDTTGDAAHALLPASEAKSSPESAAEKKAQLAGKILRQWPYIFLGCLAFVAIVTGIIIWRCCCGPNRRCCHRRKKAQRTSLLPLGNQSYKPLDDPAPPMSMQPMNQSTYQVGYQEPYHSGYR